MGGIADDTKDLIKEACEQVNCEIKALEIMPDHVHVFLSSIPKRSPHLIVKRLKGVTSNFLRKKYPQLLITPSLWTSSYYIGTVGQTSESVVKLYVENQKRGR